VDNINYTYGVLSGSVSGLREATVSANDRQRKYLSPLWALSGNVQDLAEFLIRLLRCSEHWPEYCLKYDKSNTYSVPVDISNIDISFVDLVGWADNCPNLSDKFTTSKLQTAVDRVCNKLFGVLTL
jgi:hypothetical protein